MFRAAYRSSSGALFAVFAASGLHTFVYKPGAANTV